MFEQIRYEQAGAAAIVSLHRPEAHNAYTAQMGAEITRDVDRCVRQTSQMVRVLAAESGPSTPTVLPRAEAVPVVVRAHQAQPDPEPVRHTESHPVPSTPLVAPPTRPRGRQKPPSAFGLSQVQIGVLIGLGVLAAVTDTRGGK